MLHVVTGGVFGRVDVGGHEKAKNLGVAQRLLLRRAAVAYFYALPSFFAHLSTLLMSFEKEGKIEKYKQHL